MPGQLSIAHADGVVTVDAGAPREAQRALHRAAPGAGDGVHRVHDRRGGGLCGADRRRQRVLLGHGHRPIRRRRGQPRLLVDTSTAAFRAVGRCTRPVIAAVNGPALAGGFALSLLCDVRVAHESATFGYPELPSGIPPSYAAARAVLPAALASELCLTGRVVAASEAERLGIVREVVTTTSLNAPRHWLARSPPCPEARSLRPSAACCSSATVFGGSCSPRRSACSAKHCWARRSSD